MRIGVSINPYVSGRPATIDELVGQVEGITAGGFAFAAFANIFSHDALTAIAVAGGRVPRVELMTAVVPVYTRHPMAMAQQALTTQAAIGGRLTLGIGLSHRRVVETAWGLSFEHPLEYMREYLAVLMPLLNGQPVSFTGRRIKSEAQLAMPATPPSVVLAALGERMLTLAVEHTDGTALWMVGPRTLAEHVSPAVARAAATAGKKRGPRIIVGLPVCVTDDVGGARARAARNFAVYGQLPSYRAMLDREGVDGPADAALIGSEADIEERLRAIEDAGGTEFNATVFGSADEQQRTHEFLKKQVTNVRQPAV